MAVDCSEWRADKIVSSFLGIENQTTKLEPRIFTGTLFHITFSKELKYKNTGGLQAMNLHYKLWNI